MTDRFRRRRRSAWRTDAAAFLFALLAGGIAPALAAESGGGLPLQLDVSINGQPTGLIGGFYQLADGRIASEPGELTELGLKPSPDATLDHGRVVVDTLPGVTYRYDASQQTIDFSTSDAARVSKGYDAQGAQQLSADAAGFGSVLNYGAYAAASGLPQHGFDGAGFDGASLSLDHRLYGPWGSLNSSGIVGNTVGRDTPALRLDTQWTATSQDYMVTAAAGDTISGGLSWTRPIRLGGVQLRRNFEVRPDLITMPLPSVTGSAAVPSTVDVYVNSIKTYSQQVGSGPFTINNIPVIDGHGDARVVVRDATGRESESTTPFATSGDLLKPGLFDFSADAGVARRHYGERSFDYGDDPLGLASLRYGLTDILTGEAHAEAGAGVINGGVGGVLALGRFGTFNSAIAASSFGDDSGFQLHGDYQTELYGIGITLATTRSFGTYRDLAYAASLQPGLTAKERAALAPDRAQDRIGASFQLPAEAGSLGLGALHLEDARGTHSYFLTANYAKALPREAMLSVSGYAALGGSDDFGVSLDLSAPLGNFGYGSASASHGAGGETYSASIARARGNGDGSLGWRAQVNAAQTTSGQGQLNYRTRVADFDVSAQASQTSALANAYAEGAVVMADGGVFLSRRIDDAFAIVDTGMGGVPVEFENTAVGKSGADGKLLVPGLHAYEPNKIAIITDGLPLDADYSETQKTVVPKAGSGVRVGFGVRKDTMPAIVAFTGADGQAIPPGTTGVVLPKGESFVVGYDGQAYITDLGPSNTVQLTLDNGTCTASFAYKPVADEQVMIKGVTCG